MLRRIVLVLIIIAVAVVGYLLLWPVPIDPVAWDPPPVPELTGPYAANNDLVAVRQLVIGFGEGPEDVAFDEAGLLYTGVADGRIARVAPEGGQPFVFANTGGRPLGMAFDDAGNLIVADALKGLLSISPDGAITTLATAAGGIEFGFADDLDIAPDGTIYLSDASTKFGYGSDMLDILEHAGNGRLVAFELATDSARVVLDGLQFANGVTVANDGSFVLVAETGAYRIQRVWLEGPRAGSAEVFIDNLPGFPDNINLTERGTVWVALPLLRTSTFDNMAVSPFLRKLTVRLLKFMQPAPVRYGLTVELDADGRPIRSLHDPTGDLAFITSVMERDGELFLGTYLEGSIGVVAVEVPEPVPAPRSPEADLESFGDEGL